MRRELVESYFDWNEIRLEAYLRIDTQLIELERECQETMEELKPYIELYGHEFWIKIDQIISARHAVEAYISREMYIRGFLDYERLVCEIERDV
ncbi:MAG: hypothetical protein ACI4EI_13295 [Muricoprocola sp.]